jgi:hypothetical protein
LKITGRFSRLPASGVGPDEKTDRSASADRFTKSNLQEIRRLRAAITEQSIEEFDPGSD